jgi:hypothetical protein
VVAAEHLDRLALCITWDDAAVQPLAYGEMAARSAQVANWLRGPAKTAKVMVAPFPDSSRQANW